MTRSQDADSSGRYIFEAFNVVRRVAVESDALIRAFVSRLGTIPIPGVSLSSATREYGHPIVDEEEVWSGTYWQFEALPAASRKRRPVGTIFIIIDYSGWIARSLEQPCIVVAWAPQGDDWTELTSEDVVENKDNHQLSMNYNFLAGSRLSWWLGQEGDEYDYRGTKLVRDGAWFYVVPLTSVRTKEDVGRYTIEPLAFLLGEGRGVSDDLEKAFANAPHVLKLKSGDNKRVCITS